MKNATLNPTRLNARNLAVGVSVLVITVILRGGG